MKVLLTGFTWRCVENWLPMRSLIDMDIAAFPRLADPNHANLLDKNIECIFTAPIKENFEFFESDQLIIWNKFSNIVSKNYYDAILLSSCINGPELKIRQVLQERGIICPVVGLQHGFHQNWKAYELHQESFDAFGVFGTAFESCFSEQFAPQILSMSLPKLDAIARRKEPKILRNALMLAQLKTEIEQYRRVGTCLRAQGYNVFFKPHPEHINIYDELREDFTFLNSQISIKEVASKFDLAVCPGSTSVLEMIEAGVRVAVMEDENGLDYSSFGIVFSVKRPEAVFRIFDGYDDEVFLKNIEEQMRRHTGLPKLRNQAAVSELSMFCDAWQRISSRSANIGIVEAP